MKTSAVVARAVTVGVLMAFVISASAQQAYPNKLIRIIVPYPPGSGSGIVSQLVGQKLAESLGQQVIVDNRPGGNTVIGTEALVKSPPDGHTLLAMISTFVIVPLLMPTPYDVIKDVAPVASFARSELVLVLHPSVPANNLQEFIALAKSRPGQLNYASGGSGTVTHLTGELFKMMTGVKMQHIPYKGGAPAAVDLIGGQVQLLFTSPNVTIPYIKSGKLKAIAISGETRSSALPKVPTFTEAGLPGFDVKAWYGILAPAGTPKPIVDKLSTEIARILVMPDIREKLLSQGLDPFISTPEQFAALIKADSAKYAKVIKAASVKIEN